VVEVVGIVGLALEIGAEVGALEIEDEVGALEIGAEVEELEIEEEVGVLENTELLDGAEEAIVGVKVEPNDEVETVVVETETTVLPIVVVFVKEVVPFGLFCELVVVVVDVDGVDVDVDVDVDEFGLTISVFFKLI